MHAGYLCQLPFEMPHRPQISLMRIEKTKSALEQFEHARHRMLRRGADLDQLDEIRSGLHPTIALPDPRKRIAQDRFGERVQSRFATALDLDFHFKKKIELTRENALRPARPFRDRIEAA